MTTQLPENGFLGGPKGVSFSGSILGISYDITISQLLQREIKVSTNGSYEDCLSIYNTIETLLMVMDGQFYPTMKAFDGAEITDSWKKRRLASYSSADFMIGADNCLLSFDDVLDNNLVQKWHSVKEELQLIHKMVLYCLSNADIPVDMKCAFMVEAFLGVAELISTRDPSFRLPQIPKGESKLKLHFLAVADKYGTKVFSEEFGRNKDAFAMILVNSRNRIAHIKSKQGKRYLNGPESVMYLMKLSLLYRLIILDLIDIPKEKYESALLSRIQRINAHETMTIFLSTLQ